MKPTAFVLLLVGLVLACTAALLYLTPNPPAATGTDGPGDARCASALRITLAAAAAGAVTLAWVMLRYGGRGYTAAASPSRR
jgi:hypothetical protein